MTLFSYTITDRTVFGDRRWVFGEGTLHDHPAEVSGGTISTGIKHVDDWSATAYSATEPTQTSGVIVLAEIVGNSTGDIKFISSYASGTVFKWRAYGV